MTALTVLTPAYKRPVGLRMCQASVQGQHRAEEIQHLIWPDEVGKGIAGMYRDLPEANEHINGRWVYVLSDDDVLVYPRVVDLVETVEAQAPEAQVIMVRMFCNGRVLPTPECWQAPPVCGFVTLSNWIVRADVHKRIPYGERYEGDYDHIAACWQAGLTFAWADIVVAASQQGANYGRAE